MQLGAQGAARLGSAQRASQNGLRSALRAPSRPQDRRQKRPRTVVAAWEAEDPLLGHLQQPLPLDAASASPAQTLQRVIQVVRDRNLDGLLEFCPDDVIDKLVAQKKLCRPGEELPTGDFLRHHSSCLLDTYALRNLIMAAPASTTLLSAMHAGAGRYLQRLAIVAPSGEECVLTFSVALQETSEPQYRGPPLLSRKWMLASVHGECSSDELPSHPSPSFPPEAVVEAQLAALRECRVASVFAHASPENKAATGPVESFAAMLQHNPVYSPLMGHVAAETVGRLQTSETAYMEVVRVTPAPRSSRHRSSSSSSSKVAGGGSKVAGGVGGQQEAPAPLLFMWFVSRQSESSNWPNCWMTDAVQLVAELPATFDSA